MKTKRSWTLAVLVTVLSFLVAACGDSYVVGDIIAPSDGSESNPVHLGSVPPERTFDGHIAALGKSYYQFTTTEDRLYRIRLANVSSHVDWTLYSDSSFTVIICQCPHNIFSDDVICDVHLATAHTYYLRAEEKSFIAGPYDVFVTPL